jgi:MYXO-CTERM domain-containing protein
MTRLRLPALLVLPALAAGLCLSRPARADVLLDAASPSGPPSECADGGAAGSDCTTAGPKANEKGVCASVHCAVMDKNPECDGFVGTYLLCETVDAGAHCGDGICEIGENCSSCPADCGQCAADASADGASGGDASGGDASVGDASGGDAGEKDARATDGASEKDGGASQFNSSGGCSTSPSGDGSGGALLALGALGLVAGSIARKRGRR